MTICVFWEAIGADGWAKVNGIHHQPDVLDEATKSRGCLIQESVPPEVKDGWQVSLHVKPETGESEWRVKIDSEYRMPAADFLSLLPASTRVQARQSDDLLIKDLLALIDMSVADNSSKGIHPAAKAVKEGLSYLVHLGMMTQEQMDEITEP